MAVTLTYLIPKNTSARVAAQLTAFSSLVVDQGELSLLQMRITSDTTTDLGPGDPAAKLQRVIVLSERAPDFVNTFGASEDPAVWNLKTLWQERIAGALATLCEVP